jgi:hypothetical protein
MNAKAILLTTAIALMTFYCANTNASKPKLQAVGLSNEVTIAVESVDETYLKYSNGEYLIFIILNQHGQNIFKNALNSVSDQKMGLVYGDTVLTPPLPIKTDSIGEIVLPCKDEQIALRILKHLSK